MRRDPQRKSHSLISRAPESPWRSRRYFVGQICFTTANIEIVALCTNHETVGYSRCVDPSKSLASWFGIVGTQRLIDQHGTANGSRRTVHLAGSASGVEPNRYMLKVCDYGPSAILPIALLANSIILLGPHAEQQHDSHRIFIFAQHHGTIKSGKPPHSSLHMFPRNVVRQLLRQGAAATVTIATGLQHAAGFNESSRRRINSDPVPPKRQHHQGGWLLGRSTREPGTRHHPSRYPLSHSCICRKCTKRRIQWGYGHNTWPWTNSSRKTSLRHLSFRVGSILSSLLVTVNRRSERI